MAYVIGLYDPNIGIRPVQTGKIYSRYSRNSFIQFQSSLYFLIKATYQWSMFTRFWGHVVSLLVFTLKESILSDVLVALCS